MALTHHYVFKYQSIEFNRNVARCFDFNMIISQAGSLPLLYVNNTAEHGILNAF